ncbi:hypothetical protein NPIL_176981 [Nephila pilipes]|uniref:Uncharacterized protein n=1 Tax=Nephila pilipes TaxID=299642 RepID=A0A8X6N4P7_NEPPI|nr:hypothetical protein NPIL_176981 [Nephila pilipes]
MSTIHPEGLALLLRPRCGTVPSDESAWFLRNERQRPSRIRLLFIIPTDGSAKTLIFASAPFCDTYLSESATGLCLSNKLRIWDCRFPLRNCFIFKTNAHNVEIRTELKLFGWRKCM